MITKYKTEKAALGAVQEEEDVYVSSHFCPLIQNHCNPDCVCFNPIRVTHNRNAKVGWELSKDFGCKNKMFFGG